MFLVHKDQVHTVRSRVDIRVDRLRTIVRHARSLNDSEIIVLGFGQSSCRKILSTRRSNATGENGLVK